MNGPRAALVTILLLAAVALVYAFIASAGTFSSWPTYSNYYDLLAEGFRAGRLDIPISPSPRLLAAQNPFDPTLAPLWVWDATLHDGRYYFYWGPLPAALEAVVKSVFGITRSLGDQYAVYVFALLQLVFGALIIQRLARRLFPDVPLFLVGLALLVFAFSNPIPHSLASPAVYQAAILGGQAFLLGGMLFAFDAVLAGPTADGVRRNLILAGILWALAIACRVSVGPAVALLVVATALAVRRRGSLLALGTPVALVTGLLLLYNQQRFGSWLDFGVANQLTTMPYRASASYVPLNLFSYALRPFDPSCEFPYALQRAGFSASVFPRWVSIAPGYMTQEPVVGMLLAVPWSWLAPIGMVLVPWSAFRASRALVWCAASFAILGTVTGLPGLVSFIATMRYLGDVTPGIVLSGILGAWWLHSRTSPGSRPRGLVTALCATLAVATVLLGLLLGFQGYNGHFRLHNPGLHDQLVKTLSFCGP
ncbi:MAG: hypothetical protein ACKVXR_10120 [Planctomycetota bacterium]